MNGGWRMEKEKTTQRQEKKEERARIYTWYNCNLITK
jgi:hypothetical protein